MGYGLWKPSGTYLVKIKPNLFDFASLWFASSRTIRHLSSFIQLKHDVETNPLEEIYLYSLKTAQFFQASTRSEHMVNVIMASWFISLSFITHARKV